MKLLRTLILRPLRRDLLRTALTILSVGLGVAVVVAIDLAGDYGEPALDGLDQDRRAPFAPAHVGVLPVHFDDFAALHKSCRIRSSSSGLSQARPKGFSINRTLS